MNFGLFDMQALGEGRFAYYCGYRQDSLSADTRKYYICFFHASHFCYFLRLVLLCRFLRLSGLSQ